MKSKEEREFNRRLKEATDSELNDWLMDSEMTDDHRDFEKTIQTIKAIKAEIKRRSGVKVRKVRKTRLLQELKVWNCYTSGEKVRKICENTTVKALNEFIKTTGLKVKCSLRKAEKIAAIVESLNEFMNLSATEKLEIIKAGKFDDSSFIYLCTFDELDEISKILSLPVRGRFFYFGKDKLTEQILECLAA